MFNKQQKETNKYIFAELRIKDRQVENLQEDVLKIRQAQKFPSYVKAEDSVPGDSLDFYIINHLRAIEEYLGIDINVEMEEDPNAYVPKPMRKVFKVYKKKNIKK